MAKKKASVTPVAAKTTSGKILGQEDNKRVIKTAIEQDLPVLLVGDTGTGKTSIVRELASEQGREMIRVNLNGQTSIDEFVGKWLIKDSKTYWVDGVLIQAMKNGWWILCDEINAALPEILFVLHSLLDDGRMILLSEKEGEKITPHEDFRFFGTMNPSDEYAGTKDLNKAFISRFGVVCYIDYPKPETEVEILLDRFDIPSERAVIMAEFARAVRETKKKGELYFTVSTRDLLYWAQLSRFLGTNEAFEHAVLNKANVDDHKKLINIYEGVGGKIKSLLSKYGTGSLTSLIELTEKKLKDTEEGWKKLEAERKEFDANKDEIREEILQELIMGLKGGKKATKTKVESVKKTVASVTITPEDIIGASSAEDLPF